MRSIRLVCFLSSLALLGACGDDGSTAGADANPNAPDANPNAPDADPNAPDADTSFTTLITANWSMPAGTDDTYRCAALTVDQDMWITAFRDLSPLGTHHSVVSLSASPTRADGEYGCNAGTLEHSMLFASGVGTDELAFPPGVAIKVPAGSQLHLNLHLYNASDETLEGPSGTLVKLVTADQVQEEAEVVFGGTTSIALQNSENEQTITGGCEFEADATVLTLWPHMHQLGRHMKVTHEKQSGDEVLLDQPFDFNEQVNYDITPVEVKNGERLEVVCTYLNDTGGTVFFGDSSDAEMCFVGIYRYPATNAGLFSCSEGFTPP
jgi:hypothetical protein